MDGVIKWESLKILNPKPEAFSKGPKNEDYSILGSIFGDILKMVGQISRLRVEGLGF